MNMKKILIAAVFSLLILAPAFAQQPVNNAQVAGSATSTAATGVQKVGIVGSTGTALDGTAAGILDQNLKDIGGSAASTAASGVLKVGIVGNAGAAFDVTQGGATAATNAIQEAGVYNSTLPTLTNGQGGAVQVDAKAQQLIDLNYVAGAAVATAASGIIKVGVTDSSGNAINSTSNALNVDCVSGCSGSLTTISLIPHTSGGLSVKHFVSAGSDNATNLKSSAGQVYNIHVYNNAAYPVYLKLYNSASSPTGCAATNLFKVVGVQAGTEFQINTEEGFALGTGIGYCLTKGIADSDDTAVLASDASVDVAYN
jgi:hypothetical protein